MKNLINSLFLITLMVLSTSVLTAQERETRKLGSFHGIAASSSIDAELIKGSQNKAEIEVEGYEMDEIITEVENGILKVSIKSKKKNGWTKKRKALVKVTFSDYPDFLSAGASSDVVVRDEIKTDDLEIHVSSSGDMTVEVDVDHLTAQVSSSGDLNIGGKANSAKVSVSSSGDFTGRSLEVQDADLHASSSADISISVSRSIKAQASSSADIEYYGNPSQKDINKSGQADVTQHR